jgi:ATP-dependent DNA ligase
MIGSLLLGLYDDHGKLHHVGIAASFTTAKRRELVNELAPLRENALEKHPWRDWAGVEEGDQRMPGASSRWNRGKDLSWEPLRPDRVCDVAYDHLKGGAPTRTRSPAATTNSKKSPPSNYPASSAEPDPPATTTFRRL